jgi:hypothetical protein
MESITVSGNTLAEPSGHVPLLRNWSGTEATASGNTVPANAEAVSDSGSGYHVLRARIVSLVATGRGIVGMAWHKAEALARGLKPAQ